MIDFRPRKYKISNRQLKIGSLTIVQSLTANGGMAFHECFASPPTAEWFFTNVLPHRQRRNGFSRMFCLTANGGMAIHECFASPSSMERQNICELPFHCQGQ
jgi:hypothetical protein